MGRYEYIVEVAKRNIYRDKRGRFTFAPGGAVSGAWNDENDPNGSRRRYIADKLYTEIRNRKKSFEVSAVAKHSGLSVEDVSRIYDHIFIRPHNLGDNEIRRFDPDYYMAHSWLRLRSGKNIQKHDITMLKHELAEERFMGDSLEILYIDAHKQASKWYNYQRELTEYLKKHDV